MVFEELFNQNTLNIFCDASIKKLTYEGHETLGCPGAVAVLTHMGRPNIMDELTIIERHATNNSAEIRAIMLGVHLALKYRNNYTNINIFSDSRICIQGLRDWIFNWVNCINNGRMYSSSGKEVANQNSFSEIATTILTNNLNVRFLHQKGHVTNSEASLRNANKVFTTVNGFTVDMDITKAISHFNDYIDVKTGEDIETYLKEGYYYKMNRDEFTKGCIDYDMSNFDICKYKVLTHGTKTTSIKGSFFDK